MGHGRYNKQRSNPRHFLLCIPATSVQANSVTLASSTVDGSDRFRLPADIQWSILSAP